MPPHGSNSKPSVSVTLYLYSGAVPPLGVPPPGLGRSFGSAGLRSLASEQVTAKPRFVADDSEHTNRQFEGAKLLAPLG